MSGLRRSRNDFRRFGCQQNFKGDVYHVFNWGIMFAGFGCKGEGPQN